MIHGLAFFVSGVGSSVGGTFRFGHIHWTSSGNTVTFVIETAFKRNVQNSYFEGSASDNLAQVPSFRANSIFSRSAKSCTIRRETL